MISVQISQYHLTINTSHITADITVALDYKHGLVAVISLQISQYHLTVNTILITVTNDTILKVTANLDDRSPFIVCIKEIYL